VTGTKKTGAVANEQEQVAKVAPSRTNAGKKMNKVEKTRRIA
jgi:hypothetical protein